MGRGEVPVVTSIIPGGHVTETSKSFAGVVVPMPVNAELLYEPIATVTSFAVQVGRPWTTVGPAMTLHVPFVSTPSRL
ncbi:hypothetical protein D3C86_1750990 [compost metagenome]